MTETDDRDHEEVVAHEADEFRSGGSHKGLVYCAAAVANIATLVAVVSGWNAGPSGAIVLKALALQGLLVSTSAWLALHAYRIRARLADAEEWEDDEEWESDELDEDEEDIALFDVQHAQRIHFLVLAAPTMLIVGISAAWILFWPPEGPAGLVPETYRAAASVLCLLAFLPWLVLSRSFEVARGGDLPESPALMLSFRELQWSTLLVAAGIMGTILWPKESSWSGPEVWVARLILAWILVVTLEHAIRFVVAWFHRPAAGDDFVSPVYLLSREAVFVRGNPIASVFETIEARFGVSFRSSWAIRFVRAAALPSLLLVILLFWGMTCFAVVGMNELGIRESFGQVEGDLPFALGHMQAEPLGPGLHVKYPWPFGHVYLYPVKQVVAKPIGFVAGSNRQKAFLWSEEHGGEEFNLLLGDGTEAVAVNAMVYYKIHEDKERFFDYVFKNQNPDAMLDAYAHRALMELTRSSTLEDILSADRAEFTQQLEDMLRKHSREDRLGIDVVDVALLNLHPPLEAAKEYLDVISAHIDAERFQIAARGVSLVEIQRAKTESNQVVAAAKIEAAHGVGRAHSDSARIIALGESFADSPEALRQRLWFETFEEVMANKRITVVDASIVEGGEVLLDMRRTTKSPDTVPTGVR